ncbi:exopolysaccharide biosynthesis polyprenyl glycosylphosphotransferase [Moritella marina ATCC 15381]|uniref:Exopolysaccharide biosynthesis polyprenyl glycosylphosphotransferase n=1 Tax=Moritella marina ATCC 15381 TaxID=1202962 RepID=A0A5J6WTJ6_MORMI|nr:exopolysaccharide biosynthesis polyprenyl glycosylphosphotransferase [Moritella marina]QFI40140.1 exopolysaccharide biosynthesis polyprenyl glycosylphosphotransferase [Moritella marina ATCC 15381]
MVNNKIYIFCPEYKVNEISLLCEKNSFKVIFNDYSIKDYNDKIFCHYRSADLSEDKQLYLVQAIKYGASVEPLVSYLDRILKYTEVELLHSSYFLHQKSFSILSKKVKQRNKRFLDLICAVILFMLTWPIALIAAIAIKLESPGPVLYKQKRTGLFNNEFFVYKFRSMRNDVEKDGAQWASKNDARVTKIGKFIRKTRIDELPQIINIFKSEMSIVGPRPEREVFITELEKEIPFYRFRHAVKPGVTGLAQVSYPYGASTEDAIWKHKYDMYYIKHHTFMNDIKILIKTVTVVIFGMGQ